MKRYILIINHIISESKQTEKKIKESAFLSWHCTTIKGRKSTLILLLFFLALGACNEKKNDVFQFTIAPTSPQNPRNSESDIITLKDGRLLLGYSEFYGE